MSGAPADVFSFTSASPKEISGSVTDPDDEEFGDYFVYQITVADTASAGPTAAQETFTWRFDSTIAE